MLIISFISANAMAFQNDNQQDNRPKPPSFSDMDQNGDGVLTQDEIKGPMSNDFNQIDTNNDGTVTEQEMDVFMKNHQPPTPPED